jgi:glycosyltransferase involved in cell wall biosynthesis
MSEGISFMLRVRNEEATLEKSIRSLTGLTIPHEIVVVLHCCTDRSAEIVSALHTEFPDRIRVHHYNTEISRAGYEMLATDVTSPHSICTYYNWCLAQCTKPWVFKWDADFVATPELLEYLNTRVWDPRSERHYFKACNSTTSNGEPYLQCSLGEYKKYMLWEVPSLRAPCIDFKTDIGIIHDSELSTVKSYWYDEPWFNKEDTEEAQIVRGRMKTLTDMFGPEPHGFARASNDSDLMNYVFFTIHANPPPGINPYH